MADTSKRKRGETLSPPASEEDSHPSKRLRHDHDDGLGEKTTPPENPEMEHSPRTPVRTSTVRDDKVADTKTEDAEHVQQAVAGTLDQVQTLRMEDMTHCTADNTGTTDQVKKNSPKTEKTPAQMDLTETEEKDSTHTAPALPPESHRFEQKSVGHEKKIDTVQTVHDDGNPKAEITENTDEVSEMPDCEDTSRTLALLDTVDMEAAQVLTFLKQSVSPTKTVVATTSQENEKSGQKSKSNTTLYTGSIKRKGFAKSGLAKQHLQKSVLKKLAPHTDSDTHLESSTSVSPQRMVIDLQPTRKSARQAAREDKEKPWSMMMKRGKKTRLEKKFQKEEEVEQKKIGEAKKKKETRGRKKGTKGPSLDAEEMQLAKEACDSLEKRLEENALKNNLSVVNVKNILHHVITNEHVLAMVRNTMGDEFAENKQNPSGSSDGGPVVFEPKMTRAKLKEVSEKSGKVPFVWPVSPVKKPKPQFADLNFSDSDDDDEEYKPSQEELKDESDYESTTSFGSPCPSTPRSSLNASFLEDVEEVEEDEEEEEGEEEEEKASLHNPPQTPTTSTAVSSPAKAGHLRAVAVPMGPPLPRLRTEKLKDDAKFLKQLDEVNREIEKSEDTIAHRTRSKFPINKPLAEIEASFVAPDITEDMFDTWDDCGEDNEEWVKWLASLYHQPNDTEVSDMGEDDQNDPEYNFLAEEEALDEEDFRNDKTVRISKKEVNELLDELIDAYENEDWAADFDMQHFDRPPQLTLSDMIAAQRQAVTPRETKSKKAEPRQVQQQEVMVFTESERAQLQQQMQQHVQLLCQLYVLSSGNPSLEPHMNQAKLFLSELDMLAGRSEATYGISSVGNSTQQSFYPRSSFRPCNLEGALKIIKEEVAITEKELASMKANDSWRTKTEDGCKRKNQVSRSPPTEGAQKIIAHSKVFMYSELLPLYSLTDKQLEKIVFEKAEDILIVLGLMQFPQTQDRKEQYRMICQNMLPIKTVRQVMVHVKNICCKHNIQNVIKNWRKYGIKPTLMTPCAPILPGNEVAPVHQYQLYDRKPEWLKKYQSGFYPQRSSAGPSPVAPASVSPVKPAPTPPTSQPEKKDCKDSKTNRVPTPQTMVVSSPASQPKEPLPKEKVHKPRGPSFSKLEPSSSPSLGSAGHLRVHTLLPKGLQIVQKPLVAKNMPTEAPKQSVLMINPQQGMINAVCGATTVANSGGGFAQLVSQQTAPVASANPPATTKVNPTAVTEANPTAATDSSPTFAIKANPTAATDGKSLNSRSKTPASFPNSSLTVSHLSISSSGISALQNFKVQQLKAKNSSDVKKEDKNLSKDTTVMDEMSKQVPSAIQTGKSAPKELAEQSTPKTNNNSVHNKSEKQASLNQNCSKQDTEKPADNESTKSVNSDKNTASSTKVMPSRTQPSSIPTKTSSSDVAATVKKESLTAAGEGDAPVEEEGNRPPSRSKTTTPNSLHDIQEVAEEDNLGDTAPSPGENAPENADPGSQDFSDASGLPDAQPTRGTGDGEGDVEETAEDPEKTSSLTTKMAAKRMKTKLRRDLESTVVLLDSEIVSKDPKREERETSFSRAYLNKVKERFSSEPERYVDFLGIFNSFSQAPEIPADELYQKICQALEDHTDLIEDFTAFLPPGVALECGVLMENLEFAKARLFLRQVEVHFQKNPSQFQKVLTTIMEWGARENRTNNELKESLLPLLKGQPHLEQEFSLLFPDERPPENYMMDFEEIVWDDDKDKEYDSFEEIEIPDSDEEVPITKARVGRPPNKTTSSGHTPSGLRASALHGLLPSTKAALLKGRLPSILKSPARKKSATGLKGQVLDPWQELNTQLQYGTQGCKCNCHEKSHDSRVQRKIRHCVYCSAMVNRTELISSLMAGGMGNRRRPHLLTGSQPPGTSEDATQRLTAKRGSGRNPAGRKVQKVRWASTEDAERETEEEEEEEEENPYSDAVTHLSEICANLADYLNENASEEEEEEAEEGKETDLDDDDDGNDDAEDGQDDDEFEDLDYEEETEDKVEEEEEEDEDDGADDAVITSEESRGLEGATPDSSISPVISQASHESCLLGESSSRHTSQPVQPGPSSQTTLLGSGVTLEGSGSRANSPVTYNEDDRSPEDHMRQLKECLAQEKEDNENSSNPPSVKSLLCNETLPDSPVRHFSAAGRLAKTGQPLTEMKNDKANDEGEPSSTEPKPVASIQTPVATLDSSHHITADKGQSSSPKQPAQRAIRRVTTVRPTHIPKVPFGECERVPLFESLAKCRSSPQEIGKSGNSSSDFAKKTSAGEAERTNKVQYVEQTVESEAKLVGTQGNETEELASDRTEVPEASPEEGAVRASPMREAEHLKDGDSKATPERALGTSLLSAANVARRKDGEVVVVWTRDADRLLLQRCRDQGATQEVFEEVAKTLGDKTSEQVSDRFTMLMKLFQSATQNEGEDDDDDDEEEEDSDDNDEDGSGDDEDKQVSDTQDADDNG